MSTKVLEKILASLGLFIDEREKGGLHQELRFFFNLSGGAEGCVELEGLWRDPHYRRALEEFIRRWLRYRRKAVKAEAIYIR